MSTVFFVNDSTFEENLLRTFKLDEDDNIKETSEKKIIKNKRIAVKMVFYTGT